MLGRTGLFRDVLCPYYDSGLCDRPYCHFKHDKPPVTTVSTSSSTYVPATVSSSNLSSTSTNTSTPFVGYVGYVATTRPPSETCGYVASMSRSTVPVESPVSQPKIPRTKRPLLNDIILSPAKSDQTKFAKPVAINQKKKSDDKPKDLNQCAAGLADIDREILELKKKIDAEKNAAKPGYKPTPLDQLKSKETSTGNKVKQSIPNVKDDKKIVKNEKRAAPEVAIKNESVKKAKKTADLTAFDLFGDIDQEEPQQAIKKHRSKLNKTEKVDTNKHEVRLNTKQKEIKKSREKGKDEAGTSTKRKEIKKTKEVQAEKSEADSSTKPKVVKKVTKIDKIAVDESSAKQRVAYNTTHNTELLRQTVSTPKAHLPTARQQLQMRFNNLQKTKETLLAETAASKYKKAEPKASVDPMINSHREGALAATVPKGEKRVAHIPKSDEISKNTADGWPRIPVDLNGKIPTNVRQRYLDFFVNECSKLCTKLEDSYKMAKEEEESVNSRSTTKGGYLTAAVNTVKRLRGRAIMGSNGTSSDPVDIPGPSTTVSHEAVLGGKNAAKHSYTIKRTGHHLNHSGIIDERFFIENLEGYVLTEEQLNNNGFPRSDPVKSNTAVFRKEEINKQFVDDSDLKRVCNRCGKEYHLSSDGEYILQEECVYHYGKAWKMKVVGSFWDNRFSCCKSDLTSRGCCIADAHVTDVIRRSDLHNYLHTQPHINPDALPKVYAVDCEMVYTVWGSALARISLVDWRLELILDILVRPSAKIVDCNTRFSGLTVDQLNNAQHDLQAAREQFLNLVKSNTVLIGHSLDSDLKALHVIHDKVVDTSVVFPHKRGPPYKRALRTLMQEYCLKIIQSDFGGHDSKEDAAACMELMLWKIKEDTKLVN